jgi:hypothetical protein
MIPEADRKRLIVRLEHLPQERFDIFLMLFDELLLAPALIDNQPDTQRQFVVVRKKPDLLWHSIFDNRKVVLTQSRNNPPIPIMDAQRSINQVCLHLDRRNTLPENLGTTPTQKRS